MTKRLLEFLKKLTRNGVCDHTWTHLGYGGAGWNCYECDKCGLREMW